MPGCFDGGECWELWVHSKVEGSGKGSSPCRVVAWMPEGALKEKRGAPGALLTTLPSPNAARRSLAAYRGEGPGAQAT